MVYFNLSIDDYSPHPKANSLQWANRLIDLYPNIKIDLFVPAAFCRLGDKPYHIKNSKEWIKKTLDLPPNYCINLHGYCHRRSKKDFKWHRGPNSNNNEWENLNYQQAQELLKIIKKEFVACGIPHQKVFRPTGWHVSKEACRLLTDKGYIIAGNKKYRERYKNLKQIRWISYNWDLMSPPPAQPRNIFAYAHTSTWTKNCMDEKRFKIITNYLEGKDFEFVFLKDIK